MKRGRRSLFWEFAEKMKQVEGENTCQEIFNMNLLNVVKNTVRGYLDMMVAKELINRRHDPDRKRIVYYNSV